MDKYLSPVSGQVCPRLCCERCTAAAVEATLLVQFEQALIKGIILVRVDTCRGCSVNVAATLPLMGLIA